MTDLIKKVHFKRTDFGSFGWIAKVPENLPEPRPIDGVGSIALTMQFDNVMIGSDFENNKWDIL